jgi:hypothetical protein
MVVAMERTAHVHSGCGGRRLSGGSSHSDLPIRENVWMRETAHFRKNDLLISSRIGKEVDVHTAGSSRATGRVVPGET